MNIFETPSGFYERFDQGSMGGPLPSLFTLAKGIRDRLGEQGYLLDSYLSLFLEAANAMLAYEAADNGLHDGGRLQRLCFGIADGVSLQRNHPLHAMLRNTPDVWGKTPRFRVRETRMHLLYAALSDGFLPLAMEGFERELNGRLCDACDPIRLRELFKRISGIAGEPLMEDLNGRLKQRFILVPLTAVYAQGLTSDLIYHLKSRDSETSRQVFQLLLDAMP